MKIKKINLNQKQLETLIEELSSSIKVYDNILKDNKQRYNDVNSIVYKNKVLKQDIDELTNKLIELVQLKSLLK
ncbi:MAG: hypothetical protein KBS91_04000, partial [Firmicutes bacterium]|nr:hypothetical protein [Candidatus Caballimonas caccae]